MLGGSVRSVSGGRGVRLLAALVVSVLIAASCGGSDDADDDVGSDTTVLDDSTADGETSADGDDADGDNDGDDGDGAAGDDEAAAPAPSEPREPIDSNVPLLDSGQVIPADLAGPSAELVTLQEDPYVGAAVYPRPDYEANPWSQWGQGIALADGRVISAIGDHLGADANSYLFVYDPEARTLTRFTDILSAVDHEPGSWGFGKVHSQMVDAGDGGIFFTSYYGTRRGLSYDGSYEGDVLFRLDQETLDLQPVMVPVPGHGVPSLATDGQGLVYGEAVDPLLDEDTYPAGGFFVFDTQVGEVTRFEENPRHEVFRNVIVGADGTAWFAADDDSLFRYDPAADAVEQSDVSLPAGLRASTEPASDGTVYAVTGEPFEFFAFQPDGEIRELGQASWYSTSLALLPDESGFLYVPGAHGDAWVDNTPLISVDTADGAQTTLVELLQPVRDEFGLALGGTYSVTIDPVRNHAHIGFNAGTTTDSPWGEVVFVVVELP